MIAIIIIVAFIAFVVLKVVITEKIASEKNSYPITETEADITVNALLNPINIDVLTLDDIKKYTSIGEISRLLQCNEIVGLVSFRKTEECFWVTIALSDVVKQKVISETILLFKALRFSSDLKEKFRDSNSFIFSRKKPI